jgi:hypothetical protein
MTIVDGLVHQQQPSAQAEPGPVQQ